VLAELGIEFSAPPEILDVHRIVKRNADIPNPS
jgi:hypothetical protein